MTSERSTQFLAIETDDPIFDAEAIQGDAGSIVVHQDELALSGLEQQYDAKPETRPSVPEDQLVPLSDIVVTLDAQSLIRSTVLRWCARGSDAEDYAQDVTTRVFANSSGRMIDLSSWRQYLKTMAKNYMIAEWRKRTLNGTRDEETLIEHPAFFEKHGALSEDFSDAVCSQQVVRKAIRQLSPEHRQVIHMFYYQDMTTLQISKTLGMPEGSVRSRIFCARRHMYNLLTGTSDPIRNPLHTRSSPTEKTAA